MEFGDTLIPGARALNGHGDSVTADIFWVALDTAVITVLDSTTGATRGDKVGTGRLQARVELLRSNPVPVTVITHLDSAQALEPTRDTVTVSQPDSLSDSLRVQLFATPTVPSQRRGAVCETPVPARESLVGGPVPPDQVPAKGRRAGRSPLQVALWRPSPRPAAAPTGRRPPPPAGRRGGPRP